MPALIKSNEPVLIQMISSPLLHVSFLTVVSQPVVHLVWPEDVYPLWTLSAAMKTNNKIVSWLQIGLKPTLKTRDI